MHNSADNNGPCALHGLVISYESSCLCFKARAVSKWIPGKTNYNNLQDGALVIHWENVFLPTRGSGVGRNQAQLLWPLQLFLHISIINNLISYQGNKNVMHAMAQRFVQWQPTNNDGIKTTMKIKFSHKCLQESI